jgi:hypothetical protein
MLKRRGLIIAVAGVDAMTAFIGACADNQEHCDKNGLCVTGDLEGDPGGAGVTFGGGALTPCSGDSECDDGNPCTSDWCDSHGYCKTAPAKDSIGDPNKCRECVDGMLVPVASQTPCGAGKACDGSGQCVTCSQDHPCPKGQSCNGDGDGASCESGFCVDHVCCSSSCTTCQSCNLSSPGECTNVSQLSEDSGCEGTHTCDGKGKCKTANGQSCSNNDECASGHCDAVQGCSGSPQ